MDSTEPVKLYQCYVKGPMAEWNGTRPFFSQKVFRTREGAEQYMPAFKEKCLNPVGPNDWFLLASIEREEIIELLVDQEYE